MMAMILMNCLSKMVEGRQRLNVLLLNIQSWPEWNSNPQPRAYRENALTTELSGRTIMCLMVYRIT